MSEDNSHFDDNNDTLFMSEFECDECGEKNDVNNKYCEFCHIKL